MTDDLLDRVDRPGPPRPLAGHPGRTDHRCIGAGTDLDGRENDWVDMQVVHADAPRLLELRWDYPGGQPACCGS